MAARRDDARLSNHAARVAAHGVYWNMTAISLYTEQQRSKTRPARRTTHGRVRKSRTKGVGVQPKSSHTATGATIAPIVPVPLDLPKDAIPRGTIYATGDSHYLVQDILEVELPGQV